jgi:UDP-N-acetylmuramoyl-tripeptide--D-alanyl-D-alanine ligase
MIRILILILWILYSFKVFLFWIWLWQLKEYHYKRFFAHFETQKLRKFFFSFKSLKLPKFTPKIFLLVLFAFVFHLYFIISSRNWVLFSAVLILEPIIASILIFIFQIPSAIWTGIYLRKAEKKISQFKNLLVIGISGSYGKTSVKEILSAILSKKYKVLKTERHINAEIGIAKTILEKLSDEHQILIAEIGAYEIGKIREVFKIIKPKIGILTGINDQHLSTFGSKENIIDAKFELIDDLPKNGTAILNAENEFIRSEIENRGLKVNNIKLCSIKDKLDVWAEDINIAKDYLSFKILAKDGDLSAFKINLIGRQNIENILLAVCCAKELGMSLKEISEACRGIGQEQGSIKFLKKSNPVILDTSYSSNPTGVFADLDYLKLYSGKKIVIMPCLIELNGVSKEMHRKIGEKIGHICDLAIITTKDRFKDAEEGFSSYKQDGKEIMLIENYLDILKIITGFDGENDVILLEGRVPKALVDSLKK